MDNSLLQTVALRTGAAQPRRDFQHFQRLCSKFPWHACEPFAAHKCTVAHQLKNCCSRQPSDLRRGGGDIPMLHIATTGPITQSTSCTYWGNSSKFFGPWTHHEKSLQEYQNQELSLFFSPFFPPLIYK